mgnify:CR=1 FL=1|jgi:hypothetical protein|nr:MAG TPA: Putative collagen-binding domain of a collagenase [Caudoviricetes sp.]
MNLQKITITKSSLYFRECKATPQMPVGSTYNDCLQCLVDSHNVPDLSRWHDPKTGKLLAEPRGKTPPVLKS